MRSFIPCGSDVITSSLATPRLSRGSATARRQPALALYQVEPRPDLAQRGREIAERQSRIARGAPMLISFARQALIAIERDTPLDDLRALAPLAQDGLALVDGRPAGSMA